MKRGVMMKTIGLLGGMSFESTTTYYKVINQLVQERLGGSHSAKLLMYSFDYDELEKLLEAHQWEKIVSRLVEEGKKLKSIGASHIVLCANTMHIVAEEVEKQVGLPLIHIVKSTRNYAVNHQFKKVLLLGTRYTMDSPLYINLFKEAHIDVITPDAHEKEFVHQTIYQELIRGKYLESSRKRFIEIIKKYELKGIEAVILGCTEIPLLIHQEDVELPILDTMKLHITDIVNHMLDD
jgi:aspartate racemase